MFFFIGKSKTNKSLLYFGPHSLARSTVYLMGVNKFSWAVLDVETTGFSPTRDRVISIGLFLLDENFQTTFSWSTLLNPGVDVGPTHVHGLTNMMVKHAPTFAEVLPFLKTLLDGRVLIAHNASFDCNFLQAEAYRCYTSFKFKRVLCTLENGKRLLSLSNYKLETIAKHFKVKQVKAHDAFDDAKVLNEIFVELKKNRDIKKFVLNYPDFEPYRLNRPKHLSIFKNPGVYNPKDNLIQGQSITFTGPSLYRLRCEEAAFNDGFEIGNSVITKTSLLVKEPGSKTSKTLKAEALNIPIVSYENFLELLENINDGNLK